MDPDDAPSRPDDFLDALVRQDIDSLSVAELDARITVLQGEIARCQLKKIERSATAPAPTTYLDGDVLDLVSALHIWTVQERRPAGSSA
ncbi:DUF1192 family protein [Sphingomonas aerolata]|uniref:DUF1192 family protein n=1 Tax=Sphingomonas aerolata TaxID=185951 RepID=UPI003A5C1101